jgi:DNA ligase (NAD+)
LENVKMASKAELCSAIEKADNAYYRPGSVALMSDAEYDALKVQLRQLDPAHELLSRVGPRYSAEEMDQKVKHSIPMGSLDNTDDGILGYEPWLEWLEAKLGQRPAVMATYKVDGGSICATYKQGRLVRVATRGNGEVGEDITANAVNFRHLPTQLEEPIDAEVRGEAILPVEAYREIRAREFGLPFDQIPEADRSNPRNMGNGIMGRHDGTDSDKIEFLAFNVEMADPPFTTEGTKFVYLRDLGFEVVPGHVCMSVDDFQQLYDETVAQRANLDYEIDGLVVVVNELELQNPFITADPKTRLRPKYARAVKFPHKSNVTTLEGVEVTVGHTGAIIPTAVLKTVRIGGVNVDSALLNNYDEIQRLGVAIGDEVEVVLTGDIIPKIIRKVSDGATRTPIAEPSSCPKCSAPTSRNCRGKMGAVCYCSNPNCEAVVFAKLDHWIGTSKKGVGILGIGDGMIRALWENGMLRDPADLYTLTADQIKDVKLSSGGRIGKSRAEKVVAAIQTKKQLKLSTFLGALGIDLLGRRRVDILAKAAGGQLDRLEDWLDTARFQNLEIPGLGDTIREAVVKGIEANRPLIEKLGSVGVTTEAPKPVFGSCQRMLTVNAEDDEHLQGFESATPKLPFTGLSFCFTGTRDGLEEVEQMGGTIKSGVSKGLTFLVQKDALSQSNKTRKAEELEVQIISVDYLKRAIRGEVTLSARTENSHVDSDQNRLSIA